jgi:hypothetical protein
VSSISLNYVLLLPSIATAVITRISPNCQDKEGRNKGNERKGKEIRGKERTGEKRKGEKKYRK